MRRKSAGGADMEGAVLDAVQGRLLLTEKSPDLAAVVKAWPDLPEAVKAGIVAMVKASAAWTPNDLEGSVRHVIDHYRR